MLYNMGIDARKPYFGEGTDQQVIHLLDLDSAELMRCL